MSETWFERIRQPPKGTTTVAEILLTKVYFSKGVGRDYYNNKGFDRRDRRRENESCDTRSLFSGSSRSSTGGGHKKVM